jgi:hypothetical protein
MLPKCLVFKKPIFWFIIGTVLVLGGIGSLVASVLVRNSVLKSVTGGIESVRFMDTTRDPENCESSILGDATCPSKRFKAWSLTSSEKYETCMNSEAPESQSISSASKWCDSTSEAGCVKPITCKPGHKYAYYFFSV